jgi:hydroxymethylbilane synthase
MSAGTLKLGTRTSKLAWAQSSWVANQLQVLHPGLKVELIGITTRGDVIQDRPLQEAEGKDFFVKELDHALLNGEVDICVHSFKDLSLERPEGIILAAIPKRLPMHDIIFFRPGVSLDTAVLTLGSSAPRRATNIPAFLSQIMPKAEIKMQAIRGNINSRLVRLRENLDGVVLAACGLERLYMAEPEYTSTLIKDCPWILCPISENPTAPSPGCIGG